MPTRPPTLGRLNSAAGCLNIRTHYKLDRCAPFVEVAQDPKITRAWMRDFATMPHMHMLNTDRIQTEANALTAYLLSLRRTR